MSRRTKWTLGLAIVVVVIVGISALSAAKKSGRATEVRLEPVSARDLVAAVTASGKIEAKTKVEALAVLCSAYVLKPEMAEPTIITLATPMMMPRRVKKLRSLCARMESHASFSALTRSWRKRANPLGISAIHSQHNVR